MKNSEAELQERKAQIEREIQALREQLSAWRERTPEAIQRNYPAVYELHQAIASRAVELRLIERRLQQSAESE